MDCMIDIETLGTRPDAAVLQIGAVMFDAHDGGVLHNGKGFNQFVTLQDGGGSVDHGTLCFWLQQPGAARFGAALQSSAKPLKTVLQLFNKWPKDVLGIEWSTVQGVWAMPVDFDLPILRSAYAHWNQDVPWNRRATRDARTLFSITGYPSVDKTGFRQHDALDDAVVQAMQVQKAMGQIQHVTEGAG